MLLHQKILFPNNFIGKLMFKYLYLRTNSKFFKIFPVLRNSFKKKLNQIYLEFLKNNNLNGPFYKKIF